MENAQAAAATSSWWHSADAWIAVGTVGLAVVTLGLLLAGLYQIMSIRDEARKSRTLEICGRYDFDPVLDRALRNLKQARDEDCLTSEPKKYSGDATQVLNYLDGIAIGIEQELYIEELARDHLEAIVRLHVGEYLDPEVAKKLEFDPRDWSRLVALAKRWDEYYIRYKGSRWSRRRQR